MSNSPSKGTSHLAYTGFSLDRSTPSLWRVTFDNPPINLIDPVMIVALHDLLAEIEQDNRVAVVVFDSADPDFFLAPFGRVVLTIQQFLLREECMNKLEEKLHSLRVAIAGLAFA